VVCSPALRTRETWSGVVSGLGATDRRRVEYQPALYTAGVDEVLDVIAGVADQVSTVLVIGHNPTLSMASAHLDPTRAGGIRTAGIAVHTIPGPWSACRPASAPLVQAHTARA
jgi:phosphohistidine phosphatase